MDSRVDAFENVSYIHTNKLHLYYTVNFFDNDTLNVLGYTCNMFSLSFLFVHFFIIVLGSVTLNVVSDSCETLWIFEINS